ncbi:MAG: inositol monophosphatase [Acidobacteria bacterium]|nr:inositol monophosphatase [Acidobacteriota bacterium]
MGTGDWRLPLASPTWTISPSLELRLEPGPTSSPGGQTGRYRPSSRGSATRLPADRDSEEAIIWLISRHRPADGIVGEQGASTEGTTGRRWLIDPLDGTVNFLHGFPHVSVSVAVEDDEGGLAGVVYDVFRQEEFAASRNGGTELDGHPIRVTGRDDLSKALIATGFSYNRHERGPEYGAVLGEMLRVVRGIRRGGSAALDLAWVACGRLDGYWEVRLGPWDVAAGFLLVTEAGGIVTALDGGSPSHHDCVAANPYLQPLLREAVAAAGN